jgi:hypothetical protein
LFSKVKIDSKRGSGLTTAAGTGLGTTIKFLLGAAGIAPGKTFKYCAQCLCVEPELPPCIHKQKFTPDYVFFCFGGSK